MKPSDIREFASRDWQALAASKAAFWAERKRAAGAGEMLCVAEDLRLLVRLLRPDWPTEEDRREDLETHRRVSEQLRSAAVRHR